MDSSAGRLRHVRGWKPVEPLPLVPTSRCGWLVGMGPAGHRVRPWLSGCARFPMQARHARYCGSAPAPLPMGASVTRQSPLAALFGVGL